ncbi:protein translocase subunit SecF [Candidatus Beckwithbacteria bacterium CG22_combo_CG10-13_8_21_14_all_01_47_9]|uniref:Protein-export membrane protein SecF n=5 Tax=Candidatus Beckwithiibacteriota TaxID=1752726 RepID=A0A2H0E226_9BACT|nr:MAG: protein-export membrane protein SecF [Candidatus Beckwithbacteria bacterium CG1_02_47_37]PIP52217.1 MAG: protein translocase subunit SecF [Candidatus Beckwithbacteria bacterium CG23_combo_of_CG06-09_8_20_14_all_47_9]PIP88485.1 MAG: protein translocase subunit SecF [Candidatus Beckwithbacteria bacterium CG22_combo_CG10-13_8_21_14_all_01_47_9]PJA22999.1 MAG: protein translocase subunit SecF [Candidatus Beckwithbacteria bacterium CG_4_10_14_0_2_um_filter_47_25]PJC66687.1 MAG: protein trans
MINWFKYRVFYFGLSLVLIAGGSYSLLVNGLKLGLDFTGGSLLELKVNAPIGELQTVAEAAIPLASLQQSNDSFILRSRAIDSAQKMQLTETLKIKFGEVSEIRFETIGPLLGQELIQKTLIGLALAVLFILVYLAYRFRDKTFGICAVLAMLHDSLIILGAFSLLGAWLGVEIDALFVTAVLTILSFSVHDTIVLYDRIREDRRLYPQETMVNIANRAISETMTRSVNNSLTIIFMLLSLFVFGGETTRWFVLALLIGTVSGTYSSPFVAVPLLVLIKRNR